jgi:hypothetical protein
MRQHAWAALILPIILALLLMISGCAGTAAQPSATGATASAAASAKPATATASTAAETPAPTASPAAASAEPTATAKPVATAKAPSTDAFKFYKLIDIGMTKDKVDKAIGVKPKAATGSNDPANSYYYQDDSGNGVYVQYSDDLKLTSKTVQYDNAADALPPYTSKPVTQEQCDKITDGMAHADVVKLLGSDGAECSKTQSVVFGKTTVGTIYRWGNSDGSFLQVVFISKDTTRNAMFFEANKK